MPASFNYIAFCFAVHITDYYIEYSATFFAVIFPFVVLSLFPFKEFHNDELTFSAISTHFLCCWQVSYHTKYEKWQLWIIRKRMAFIVLMSCFIIWEAFSLKVKLIILFYSYSICNFNLFNVDGLKSGFCLRVRGVPHLPHSLALIIGDLPITREAALSGSQGWAGEDGDWQGSRNGHFQLLICKLCCFIYFLLLLL